MQIALYGIDSIAREVQTLETWVQWEVRQSADVVVGEIDGVLLFCYTKVFDCGDLVAW